MSKALRCAFRSLAIAFRLLCKVISKAWVCERLKTGQSKRESVTITLTLRLRHPAHVDFRCLVLFLRSRESAISQMNSQVMHTAHSVEFRSCKTLCKMAAAGGETERRHRTYDSAWGPFAMDFIKVWVTTLTWSKLELQCRDLFIHLRRCAQFTDSRSPIRVFLSIHSLHVRL